MVKRRTRPHPFSYCTPRKAVHLVRQAWHGGEAASKSGFPDHFEVRWLNGQILDLEHYSCRIYSTTDIACVFKAVHSVVVWPRTYISLVIGNTHFQYTSGPCKEELYLKNLYYTGVLEGTLRMTENHRFLISAIRHAPPCDFLPSGLSSRSIGCICDFPGHGCCHTGRTDLAESPCLPALQSGWRHHWGCRWCGEGACCRRADCGHPCCDLVFKYGKQLKDGL